MQWRFQIQLYGIIKIGEPYYLSDIFSQDFYEFQDLWKSNVLDSQLVQSVTKLEKYSPKVEDISMEDEVLYQTV